VRWSPSFECHVDPDGDRHYVVGHELVDEFLEFVAAPSRANTVRAYALTPDQGHSPPAAEHGMASACVQSHG